MLKKIVILVAFCAAASCFAATTVPVQLINPAGSSAGQAIISTGATSAPVWAPVPLAGVSGTLAIGNGGTGATNASSARTNLGLGTIATQAASNVAITGGTINGTVIGGTASASGTFTTLSASSSVSGAGFATYLASPPPIGSTVANTGSFTTLNSTGGALNGTIGATTAFAGKFTTLQATGAITPSSTAGIVGTTTNDDAQAGSLGEYGSSVTLSTSLTSGSPTNAASVTLAAGDYDVEGVVQFNPSSTITVVVAGISTSSSAFGTLGTGFGNFASTSNGSFTSGVQINMIAPRTRVKLASSGTVYLVAQATFASTCTVHGFIRWRRVR